ncbi:diacylglycerol kinase family protein [Niveibacterium terrae]|uniref:diacylglycerol kinase family protein n=1 Tax=Niveibacterium terrae TaxID=3373598 RepID=UPI003A91C7C3
MEDTSLLKLLEQRRNSFRYAANGVRIAFSTQAHAKIHLVAALAVVYAGWLFAVSPSEWCALLLAIALVWVSEAINTAVEFTVDLLSPGYHETAGKAKDVAAGAVLLAAGLAAIVGGIIFIPKLLAVL